MGRRNDHSRDEIREMALTAGIELLEDKGMPSLSARKIASRINYTVGTLYLVFENLDDLILQINLRTLVLLSDRIRASIDKDLSAVEQMKKMAAVYLAFAVDHENRWRLVYEHASNIRNETYDEYMRISKSMLMLVEHQLVRIATESSFKTEKQARALWGGVHGICILSLSGKLHHGEMLIEDMTGLLIDQFVYGMKGKS